MLRCEVCLPGEIFFVFFFRPAEQRLKDKTYHVIMFHFNGTVVTYSK